MCGEAVSNQHEAGVVCATLKIEERYIMLLIFMWKIPEHAGTSNLPKVIFTEDVAKFSSQITTRVPHPNFVSSRSDFDRTHRAFHHATAPAIKMK